MAISANDNEGERKSINVALADDTRRMHSITDLFGSSPTDACDVYGKPRAPENSRVQRVRDYCEHLWSIIQYYAEPRFIAESPIHLHER